jgi:hypothetical protein
MGEGGKDEIFIQTGRDHMGDIGVHGGIITKWILKA